jgi:hypothetical protein
MKSVFVIAVILLGISAYPIYLEIRENAVGNRAYERYTMQQHSGENYDYKSAEFAGHRVLLSNGPTFDGKPTVSTTIDAKDYSLNSPIELDERGGYNSWAHILTLTDREKHEDKLAVIQRVAGKQYPDDTRYRILFLAGDGSVSQEWFSYGERANPPYRAMLAQYVHPEPLGISSQINSYYPTLFFPILYPWGSALIGFLLLLISAPLLLIRRKRKTALAI